MTIKEVSEKYGITADTLRYYEQVGIIPPIPRTEGGVRNYGKKDLEWIELVICVRKAGIPVSAMAEYMKLYQMGDATFAERLELMKKQRELLLMKKAELEAGLDQVEYKIERYEAALKTGRLIWTREGK